MTRYAPLFPVILAVVAAGCDSTPSSSPTTEKPAAPVTQTATTPTKEGKVLKNKLPVETRRPKSRSDL